MPGEAYRQVLDALLRLDRRDQEKLFEALLAVLSGVGAKPGTSRLEEARAGRSVERTVCPHCGFRKIIRFGRFGERQRWRCRGCGKTFSDFTGTPLSRTRLTEQWVPYIECMLDGRTLRGSAQAVGGVSYVTLFYWRHKILSALRKLDVKVFEGVVEADETFFLYSEKGSRHIVGRRPRKRKGPARKRGISNEQVCVLVARDREKQTFARVACTGRISRADLDRTLGPRMNEGNILCTDAHAAYGSFARERGIRRFVLTPTERVKQGVYHIQNVNAYHSRLKSWIARFIGVASKYLDNYLAWHGFIDARIRDPVPGKRKEMFDASCRMGTFETCRSLREAGFTIAA